MIIARAPLRISFAGGGTDIPDYYCADYGAVCSMAINKYVYLTINNLATYFPHRFRIAYSQTELVQDLNSIQHPIVREALRDYAPDGGIDISIMADVPAGTGMGSSSSFTVGLLHALKIFGNSSVQKDKLAQEACRLELEKLKEPIGKQDQYASSFGGVNLFKFHKNEQVDVLPILMSNGRKIELQESLLLFYLNGDRSASKLLKVQAENIGVNRVGLDKMKEQALYAAEILSGQHDLAELGEILRESWKLKSGLAAGITNEKVDSALNKAMGAGAIGGKLLGAGGTGFLLLFCKHAKQNAVREALKEFKEVDFSIDTMGSTVLYYDQ